MPVNGWSQVMEQQGLLQELIRMDDAGQLNGDAGLDQYHHPFTCYERPRQVFATPNELRSLAVVTFNSANIYSSLDDFRRAQALYERAYELHSAQGMERAAAQVRYSLGYLHFLKGEYHQAMRVLHEVREEMS